MKTKHLLLNRCLIFVAVAVFTCPLFADTNRYTGDTWALVDAKKVMAAAADITLENTRTPMTQRWIKN